MRGRGGRGPPPPAKPTVLHSVRTCNDCGTYSLIYHTLYIGTSHTQTSIMFTRKKHLGPPGGVMKVRRRMMMTTTTMKMM